jgi:hypothetical protein
VACLLFIATLETEQGPIVLKAQSKPISLSKLITLLYAIRLHLSVPFLYYPVATAPEPAELDWLEPSRGHFGGQEVVVIKGSKMTSRKCSIFNHKR